MAWFAPVAATAALWCLFRGYQGLYGDAQIYAFQALARIDPALLSDLYLQNTSQDQFSIFSVIYAAAIRAIGLHAAALSLTLIFSAWLYVAAWQLASNFAATSVAWFSVGLLVLSSGEYGASGVFHFAEPFLSARLPAEALIITALACQFKNHLKLALAIAVCALLIHPLIALPGLLILVGLRMPARAALLCALSGILVALSLSAASATWPTVSRYIPIMDTSWLYVVRERSQYLFLRLWTVDDWALNLLPLIFLGFAAASCKHKDLKKLCVVSIGVGLTGFFLAAIPDFESPLAILIQGQAWRWIWIASFLSVALLPIVIANLANTPCGPVIAALLIGAWTVPGIGGILSLSLAIASWLSKDDAGLWVRAQARPLAILIGVLLILWAMYNGWHVLEHFPPARRGPLVQVIAGLPPAKLIAVAVFGLIFRWLSRTREPSKLLVISLLFSALVAARLPEILKEPNSLLNDKADFSEWTRAIPKNSTVLIAPARDAGAFVWFTLQRPNYLALDQSAGVVFSRETALEVIRRSEILLPLQEPSWQIRSGKRNTVAKTLTPKVLEDICIDPKLGFVASPQDLDFPSIRNTQSERWKSWRLFECSAVRNRVARSNPT